MIFVYLNLVFNFLHRVHFEVRQLFDFENIFLENFINYLEI